MIGLLVVLLGFVLMIVLGASAQVFVQGSGGRMMFPSHFSSNIYAQVLACATNRFPMNKIVPENLEVGL